MNREPDERTQLTSVSRLREAGPELSAALLSGPEELRKILSADRDGFSRALTSKLLTYALGRGLERYDTKTVKAIADRLPAQQYRFSAMVLEIVKSLPFQSRRPSWDTSNTQISTNQQ